ncbi:conserved hypothetical protein [Kribbella flavida DSM 17836]|uniref:Polyketide cyclase/dehydrase n=1 Tax=Kribbella flavida (strain DSM 17836 / JCM 10339 / NBRC 14399) TaxID=479435 RepID=D2PQQ3_KRIFD|nr:SRPBCC family protein [Kribbella flavida]ADB31036.1 conserved hypothetical protein [Kribbella flavida DSM 17836]
MHTKLTLRCETRSISVQAPPAAVLDLVADPRNLPRWAPGLGDSVHADGDDHWLIRNGTSTTRMIVRVAREQGTVDMLSADDPRLGAFTRVLPNGDGSEYQFSMLFPDSVPEPAVQEQLTVVEAELEAVRTLCEAAGSPGDVE